MKLEKTNLYLLLPLLLWLLQALYNFNSLNNLSGDEIYTIRDVLPFQNRELAGPGASSTSFYAAMLASYQLFGFDLYMAKYLRLGLQLISLICLALLLKKYLPVKYAWFPLLIIGLSPTLLFWNTTGAAWGIDLQFLPIVLFLISMGRFGVISSWFVSMIAWMAYPNFIFYLPFLIFLTLTYTPYLKIFILSAAAFVLPLISLYLYIEKRGTLFYDPQLHRGLFTGGGEITFNEDLFLQSFAAVLVNLFDKATSYMYQVSIVDFSHLLPVLTFLFIIFIPLKFLNSDQKIKPFIWWCFITMTLNLILTGLMVDGSGMPGGRRNTPFLASIYGLFTITWYLIVSKKIFPQRYKQLSLSILFILLIHHFIAYPINLQFLQTTNFTRVPWFYQEQTPHQSLNKMLSTLTKQDLKLDCENDLNLAYPTCYYSSVYAVLIQACYYQKLNCQNIQARFPYSKNFQTLDYHLFSKEYWDK